MVFCTGRMIVAGGLESDEELEDEADGVGDITRQGKCQRVLTLLFGWAIRNITQFGHVTLRSYNT